MPCGGRIAWRGNPEDWTECPDCAGTGMGPGSVCPRCKGDGWLMGRH
jgi:DnaJ-class molecular chaperone